VNWRAARRPRLIHTTCRSAAARSRADLRQRRFASAARRRRGGTARRASGSDDQHLAKYADYSDHPFTALNTANRAGRRALVIADGAIVDGFIHLLFIGDGDGIWSHPRNLIVAGRGSQVTVVETYVGNGSYFTNAVTEIVAGEGAVVDHYKLECESLEAFTSARCRFTRSAPAA
jgi:Fe-S cluster assembly scaffold protein SufB